MREVDKYYDIIKDANFKLDEIRKNCPHKETYEGLYMWRIGSAQEMIICKTCDEPLQPIIKTTINTTYQINNSLENPIWIVSNDFK